VKSADQTFKLNAIVSGSGGFTITYPTHPGRMYQVQVSSNLVENSWTSVSEYTVGSSNTMTYAVTNGLPAQFFRVRAQLP
jgi:hypothetical protein